jgi:hypothetical protein
MAYDNTNSGASFKNDKKLEDWHADFRGSVNVDGVDYWIDNTWYPPKEGKKGFMRHKFKRKEQQSSQVSEPESASQPAAPAEDFTNDVPW